MPPGARLIAALNSLQPNRVWPLVNAAALDPRPELMFGDVGCYYLYLDRKGRLKIAFDCY